MGGWARALTAREKGTATAALKLLERAAKRQPSLAHRAALLASETLVHSAADVQSRALDLIEAFGDCWDSGLQDSLAARLDDMAPSLRGRLAALLSAEAGAPVPNPTQITPLNTEDLSTRANALDLPWANLAGVPEAAADVRSGRISAPSLRLNPLEIPRLDPLMPIEPIQNVDTLIGLFASVIEH